jgi:hypothetical protein
MKTLKTLNGWDLVILDENNYGVGKVREKPSKGGKGTTPALTQAKYYNDLDGAVKGLARLVANDQCKGLDDWLTIYRTTVETMLA